MTNELPTADQVVEELADRVASRIEHGAPVAFESSLDELVDYHRFLLGLNQQPAPTGRPFSYAEIEGATWNPPHRNWIRQYRRLFEKAADKISSDTQFIETLSYVPYRLIQPLIELRWSDQIVRGILDLMPMLIHSYEAWFTRRSQVVDDSQASVHIAGSDSRSYSRALRSTIGAWESLLQAAPYILGWREKHGISEDQLWKTYCESWPLLWSHLSDSAYCLAVAVWNEDQLSANLFGETLVRWPAGILDDFPHEYGFRLPHLLFPDLLKLSWDEAQAEALKLAFGAYECTPGAVFAAIIRQARNDVLLVMSSLLLHWIITRRRNEKIGSTISRRLLRQEIDEDDPHRYHEWSLSSISLQMMRLQVAGERFEDGSYGADLDHFLRTLDGMSERDIVPGRVFTPSTLNDREGLLSSDVAILASAAMPGQQTAIHPELLEWIENPSVLPGGDQSLRAILSELDRYETVFDQAEEQLVYGLRVLIPEVDDKEQVARLRAGIDNMRSTIAEARRQRLAREEVDQNNLEDRRQLFEAALLTPPADAPFFDDVAVEKLGPDKRVKLRTLRFLNIPKERMVEPPMGPRVVNEAEVQIKEVRSFSGNQVFADLARRKRYKRKISWPVEVRQFWEEIRPLIEEVGSRPILLISAPARMRLFERIFKADPIEGLQVEKRQTASGRNQYITTVEGVDVFGGVTIPGSAWLLSRDVIAAVQFAVVNDPDRFVEVAYDLEPDAVEGVLRTEFRQRVRWGDGRIFEINCPDAVADE